MSIQMDEARRLEEKWAAKGSPPCSHPSTEKELYLGTRTGDKVCTTCGAVVP